MEKSEASKHSTTTLVVSNITSLAVGFGLGFLVADMMAEEEEDGADAAATKKAGT